ncbi:MAG TPA: putative glycolipid-binding domain-containing protein, partial [Ktedonobacterales bacterium]
MIASEDMQQKQQIVVWEARQWASMEYLRLEQRAGEIAADGTIIMVADDQPLRIRYTIRCDAAWAARQVSVRAEGVTGAARRLSSDGAGHWTRSLGHPLAALDDCIDVDIAATPFTNTLPIRRLALQPGQSVE